MVINGWKQIGLLNSFEKAFQRQVMMENMDNILFNTNGNALAIDFNNTHYNENVDVEVPINIVMEASLTRVTQFLNAIVSLNISSLKCLAIRSDKEGTFLCYVPNIIFTLF
jgi:capsid portal protein